MRGPTLRAVAQDGELLDRLRDGDETAFVTLVACYHQPMMRFARSMVQSRAVAEEAVQDTWLGVVRGIDRFEGRSSLKTWLFQILANRARTAAANEPSSMTMESLADDDGARFDGAGRWITPPERWTDDADDRLDAAAWLPVLVSALHAMPHRQRQVVLLRDVESFSGAEVSAILGISLGNQRILLHRGRSRLRAVLDTKMNGAR
jgi:RNA polymerase sigma-70 factor (ECF subfamily)